MQLLHIPAQLCPVLPPFLLVRPCQGDQGLRAVQPYHVHRLYHVERPGLVSRLVPSVLVCLVDPLGQAVRVGR
jgi:hypothetical protein